MSTKQVAKHSSKNAENTKLIAARQSYSGPIPDPNTLAKYEEIVPGAADRILSMAEKEAIHRQGIEKKLSSYTIILSVMGMILAFLSVLSTCYLVYYALNRGFDTSAATIAVGAIASVGGIFLIYKRPFKKTK